MRHALIFSTLMACLGACGWPETSLPDGGRARINCDQSVLVVPVTVLDAAGAPTGDATVTAVNASDSTHTVSGTTNGSGIFKVTSELGPGVIKVSASLNDLKSPEGHFTVTPSDCTPAISPNALTLQLR